MARAWKCEDCPQEGVQKGGGFLRQRCDDCQAERMRAHRRRHYANNRERVIAKTLAYQRDPVRADQIKAARRIYKRRGRRARSPMGYIYVIEAIGSGTIKIGFTATQAGIEKRRKDCQTGNAHLLQLKSAWRGSMMEEADLHRALADFRLQGEWFTLNDQVLGAIKRAEEATGP